jgi:hypothetical protein
MMMHHISLVLCCVCLLVGGRAADQPNAESTSALPWAARLDSESSAEEQHTADSPLQSSANAVGSAEAVDPDLLSQAASLDPVAVAADLGLDDSFIENERSLDTEASSSTSTAESGSEQQSTADQMAAATADLNAGAVEDALSTAATNAETTANDSDVTVAAEPAAVPGPRNIVDVLVDQGLMSAEEANTLTMRGHRGLLNAAPPPAMAHAQLIDPTMIVEPEVVVEVVVVPAVTVPVLAQQNSTMLTDEQQGSTTPLYVVTACEGLGLSQLLTLAFCSVAHVLLHR